MTLMERLVHTGWAAALGSALVHFLWQGALAALVLAVALRITRPASARLRYALACLAMLALPVAFGLTFSALLKEAPARYPLLIRPRFPDPIPVATPSSPPSMPGPAWTAILPWLAPVWMVGVALLYLRSMACWLAAQRLRRLGVCAASEDWQDHLARWKRRMRITRPVILLESCFAEVPAVVGFVRPAILIPLGLLSGFPAEQVEAFLVHELAHIRRYDYLVNLVQILVEGLLFYHPGVWWISKQVRAEREHCCDDAVVALTGDLHSYATALTTFETKRWTAETALAATGGNLMQRIHRLLGKPQPNSTSAPAVVLLLVCAGAALAAWSPQPEPKVVASAPQPKTVEVPIPSKPAGPAKLVAQVQSPSSAQDAGICVTDRNTGEVLCSVRKLEEKTQTTPGPQTPFGVRRNEETLYIITPEEVAAFKRLQTDEERRRFIEQFPPIPVDPLRPELVAQAQRRSREAELKAQLETPYQKWLNEDVAYIIAPEERDAFQRLASDQERDHFIEQFWLRRDPTPGTERNEFKEEHYRRIGFANGRFAAAGLPGWKTDRGRIYITFGPPDEIDSHPSGGAYERPPADGGGQITTVPFEDWRYRHIEGIGNDVIMEFVDPALNGLYRMTNDPSAKDSIRYVPGDVPVRPPARRQ